MQLNLIYGKILFGRFKLLFTTCGYMSKLMECSSMVVIQYVNIVKFLLMRMVMIYNSPVWEPRSESMQSLRDVVWVMRTAKDRISLTKKTPFQELEDGDAMLLMVLTPETSGVPHGGVSQIGLARSGSYFFGNRRDRIEDTSVLWYVWSYG